MFAVPDPKPQEGGRGGGGLHCRVSCPGEAPNTMSQQSLSFLQLALPASAQAQGARQQGDWPTLVRISPQTPSSPKACRFLYYLCSIPLQKKKKKFLFLLNFNPGNGETQFAFGF